MNLSSDYPAKFHAIRIILHFSVSHVGEKNTHFWPSWIVLHAVTIYRRGTQTYKLKLTLANFLSFVWLLSFKCHVYLSSVIKMRKMTKLGQKLQISHSDVIRALRYYNPIYLAIFRLVRKIFEILLSYPLKSKLFSR